MRLKRVRALCWMTVALVLAQAGDARADEEVRLAVGDVVLAGDLVMPSDRIPEAAVVVLAGSGPNGRDGRIRGFPAYRVIADHLAGDGVAVLLLDRRGVGESGGDWRHETIPGRARDAVVAADFLRRRLPDIPVGLLGHSQGGWVAVEAAAGRPGAIDFLVLMAGPGESVRDQIVTDMVNQARLAGTPPRVVQRRARRARLLLEVIRPLASLCRALRLHPVCAVVDYDPAASLRRLEVPVLALFGGRDSLVPPEPNLERLRTAIPGPLLTTRVFPEANHQFWKARTGATSEYTELEPAYVPGFLEAISIWMPRRDMAVAETRARGL